MTCRCCRGAHVECYEIADVLSFLNDPGQTTDETPHDPIDEGPTDDMIEIGSDAAPKESGFDYPRNSPQARNRFAWNG